MIIKIKDPFPHLAPNIGFVPVIDDERKQTLLFSDDYCVFLVFALNDLKNPTRISANLKHIEMAGEPNENIIWIDKVFGMNFLSNHPIRWYYTGELRDKYAFYVSPETYKDLREILQIPEIIEPEIIINKTTAIQQLEL